MLLSVCSYIFYIINGIPFAYANEYFALLTKDHKIQINQEKDAGQTGTAIIRILLLNGEHDASAMFIIGIHTCAVRVKRETIRGDRQK